MSYTLPIENLPLFIDSNNDDDDNDSRSYVSFARNYKTGGAPTNTPLDDNEFLVLANPILHINSSEEQSSFVIMHPWAKDMEGDRVRLAVINIDSMIFKHAHYNVHSFTGYITSMSFNNPFDSNVFTDAGKKDDTEETWANNGYPYTPPSFTFENVALPLKVEISVVYDASDTLDEFRTRPTPRPVK